MKIYKILIPLINTLIMYVGVSFIDKWWGIIIFLIGSGMIGWAWSGWENE